MDRFSASGLFKNPARWLHGCWMSGIHAELCHPIDLNWIAVDNREEMGYRIWWLHFADSLLPFESFPAMLDGSWWLLRIPPKRLLRIVQDSPRILQSGGEGIACDPPPTCLKLKAGIPIVFSEILQDSSGCFRMLQDSLRIYGHEQGGKGGREGEESLMQSLRVKLTGDIYVTVLSENG